MCCSRNLYLNLQANLSYSAANSLRLHSSVFSFFYLRCTNLATYTRLRSADREIPVTSCGLNFSSTELS